MARIANKLLRKRQQIPSLLVKEPSQAFLEEDVSRGDDDPRLPKEVMYMLKGVRVFGFFDKPLFLEICRRLEFMDVPKGSLLFSIGDPDDSIYIVQTGKLQVMLTESDGSELVLKEAIPGDTIASLLSVMDVLSGHLAPFKTVSAKAMDDSKVLRLQAYIFREILEKYPESLVRVVQVIMVRLQRVMFTALHDYLGLTTQLVIPGSLSATSPMYRKVSCINPLFNSTKGSPTRKVSVLQQIERQKSMPECGEDRGKNELKACLGQIAMENQQPSSPINIPRTIIRTASEVAAPSRSMDSDDPIPTSSTVKYSRSPDGDTISDLPSPSKMINPHIKLLNRKRSVFGNEERLASMSLNELKQLAVEGFTQQLGLEDGLDLIKSKVRICEYPPGTRLTQEESRDGAALFYVLSGCLLVSQKNSTKDEEITLYTSHPGELVGALAVITGEVSAFTIRTKGSVRIGMLSENDTYEILAKYPQSVLHLGHTVVRRLSPFVRQIDFALDWIHNESGRAIYRQGDHSDSTYIVLSGRLRSVINREDGKKQLVGEYGKGDLIGIVELLTQTERSTTVMAVRDSELAKLPTGLLDVIKIKYPIVVTKLIHLLGHRILGTIQKVNQSLTPDSLGSRPSGSNFSTVALVAISDSVNLEAFSLELNHALSSIGPSLHLTSDFIRKSLGPLALDPSSEYRLCSWLGQQEDRHRIVLYQCDSNAHLTTWTQRCIRQADCILIVGLAEEEASVGKIEKQLEHLAVRTQKELVLLHRHTADYPRNTVKWLNMRTWCSSYHHIRCPDRVFTRKTPAKVRENYKIVLSSPPDIHSDVARLGRFLTGTSIGLVLGGGGARGAAHIGMIKAIRESGIPIDMVGGVSIGAFMSALWAQELNWDTTNEKARKWSYTMTSLWKQILDLTYPATAMFTGGGFNQTIYDVFGDKQIEDLWLPYFTVTTDITSSCPRVHRFGSLWRYVRSSMSLSGYLPPLCDPVDGHLLLDGGYVNNLPADVMRDVMGAETIIAVDVGSQDDMEMTNYGDQLNGWWILWNRWNPFGTKLKIPSLPEIQSRLAYVSCVRQLEEVKRSDYCTYIRPPIDKYKTLQFGSYNDIMDVGYIHGKTLFSAMSLSSKKSLHSLISSAEVRNKVHNKQGFDIGQQPSFIDLAGKVCKLSSAQSKYESFFPTTDGSDEDDDFDDDGLDDQTYYSEPEFAIAASTDDEMSQSFKEKLIKRKTSACN